MNRVTIARGTALTGYFGLLILLVAWNAWLSPPHVLPRAAAIALVAGPLLFPLRGILHGRLYTHAWTSFLALFYFALGVVEAYSSPADRLLALLVVAFSLLLYTGAVLYSRFKGKELRGR